MQLRVKNDNGHLITVDVTVLYTLVKQLIETNKNLKKHVQIVYSRYLKMKTRDMIEKQAVNFDKFSRKLVKGPKEWFNKVEDNRPANRSYSATSSQIKNGMEFKKDLGVLIQHLEKYFKDVQEFNNEFIKIYGSNMKFYSDEMIHKLATDSRNPGIPQGLKTRTMNKYFNKYRIYNPIDSLQEFIYYDLLEHLGFVEYMRNLNNLPKNLQEMLKNLDDNNDDIFNLGNNILNFHQKYISKTENNINEGENFENSNEDVNDKITTEGEGFENSGEEEEGRGIEGERKERLDEYFEEGERKDYERNSWDVQNVGGDCERTKHREERLCEVLIKEINKKSRMKGKRAQNLSTVLRRNIRRI